MLGVEAGLSRFSYRIKVRSKKNTVRTCCGEILLLKKVSMMKARILDADEVIKSPGIPEKAPLIQALRQKGIPMISEIEFAGKYTNAKKICITGSNGKTTTTLLTYHILKNAGLNVGLGGNVGKSFALASCRK
jgi:UDP-N-acetylmuramoylalanine-D-glutamate ligase